MNGRSKVPLWMTVLVGALFGPLPSAISDSFPSAPIRILVPYPPGGPSDVASRLFGNALSRQLKQTVIVENKSGAGGQIGTEGVLRGPQDGYTLLVGGTATMVLLPADREVQYRPQRDFVPLGRIWISPLAIIVSSTLPVSSLQEFVSYAKSNPGKIKVGSAGNGTISHLGIELLNQKAEVSLTHVPYRSNALVVTDILGGNVDGVIANPNGLEQFIQEGKLKVLAVTVPQRLPQFPNVPTTVELGYPGVVLDNWFAIFVSAQVPGTVIDSLKVAVRATQSDPDYIVELAQLQSGTGDIGSESVNQLIDEETSRWVPILRSMKQSPK